MFYTLDIRKCPSQVSLGWQSALTRWSAYQCTVPLVETRPARVSRNPTWRLQGKALGWNSRYLDAKSALLQFSSSPVNRKNTKNTGEGAVNRATKKRATCFATLLENLLYSDVARFTTYVTLKPVLQPIRLLQKVESFSTVYGVTPM